MYYVIQENIYKEHHFNTLMNHLNKYNLPHEMIPWRPFDPKAITDWVKTDRKDVWFFGSIDDGIELQKQGWYPGIMYNDQHDFELFSKKYGKHMLNNDANFHDFWYMFVFPEEGRFVRPTRDTKIFPAKVYGSTEWNNYVRETIDSGLANEIRAKTRVMVSTPKVIQQEIRCWIVDGEPVTMSQYRIGKRVNMLNMDNNEEAYIFAKDMAKIFCPSRVFVLDICLCEDEYKIVEINCANMSGFYDINISKLLQKLEETFNGKSQTGNTTIGERSSREFSEGSREGSVTDDNGRSAPTSVKG